MAAKTQISLKRIQLDKTTQSILIILTVAAVVTVMALAGSRALLAQISYQNRVISAKQTAKDSLTANVQALNQLKNAYYAFDNTPESIIGTSEKNSKVVLDALPSTYDFPALVTSLEQILKLGGYAIESIGGSDDEIAQISAEQSVGLNAAEPVEIPFQVEVTTSYDGAQQLVRDLDRTIRPMHIQSIELNGGDSSMKVSISAKTYYKPGIKLEIPMGEVQ